MRPGAAASVAGCGGGEVAAMARWDRDWDRDLGASGDEGSGSLVSVVDPLDRVDWAGLEMCRRVLGFCCVGVHTIDLGLQWNFDWF